MLLFSIVGATYFNKFSNCSWLYNLLFPGVRTTWILSSFAHRLRVLVLTPNVWQMTLPVTNLIGIDLFKAISFQSFKMLITCCLSFFCCYSKQLEFWKIIFFFEMNWNKSFCWKNFKIGNGCVRSSLAIHSFTIVDTRWLTSAFINYLYIIITIYLL